MRRTKRQSVRIRYHFCCGYCGVSEISMGAEMTVDHFQPRVQGGLDSPNNLVYSCHACNEFKGDYWQTESDLRLLHPLFDHTADHFREQEDGILDALTERGKNYIRILHLNREELIEHRLRKKYIANLERQYQEVLRLLAELRQTEETNDTAIGRKFGDPDV